MAKGSKLPMRSQHPLQLQVGTDAHPGTLPSVVNVKLLQRPDIVQK